MDRHGVKSVVTDLLSDLSDLHGTVMIAKGNDILYHEGFSYAHSPFQTDKNAQYLIASITKQFTAVALLKALYEKQIKKFIPAHDTEKLTGLIGTDLQKPLSTFLSSDHPLWKGAMPQWAKSVNLHHLLTHTSGIINYRDPLGFKPSEKYTYSNAGYLLLGTVIKEMTKEPLDIYFERALFNSAQMTESHLPLNGTITNLKNESKFHKLSLGLNYSFVGRQMVFTSVPEHHNFAQLSTSGGIVSTAHDLIKWNHALYGGKIIPPFLLSLMTTPHVQKEAHIHYDGFDTLWHGYGLDIHHGVETGFYQHSGGISGYQSRLSYNPKTNITIAHISNIAESEPSIFTFVNRLRNVL